MSGFLNSFERETLKKIYKKSVKFSRKAHVVLLLDSGLSCLEVAKICYIDESTVRRYEKEYDDGGIKKLLENNHKGSVCSLSQDQLEDLKDHLRKNIYPSSKGICVLVKKKCGVEYSNKGMGKLLRRMGFVYKKPHLVPGKADKSKQEEFVDEYKKLKAKLGPNDKIYSMDGSHPQHNSKASYGWFFNKDSAILKTNTGRKRVNLNAAISVGEKKIDAVVKSYDSINSQSTIDLLQEVERKNSDAEKIHVICDNAKYYKSQLVKDFLKTSKIELVFLPPYSPNLNSIERLWKFFHEKVTNNRYYEKFDDFRYATMSFFRNLDMWQGELLTRITDNFQIIDTVKN